MTTTKELRAEIEVLKQQVAALVAMGFASNRQAAPFAIIPQTAHGFAVGNPIRVTSSGWTKSQADTEAHAVVDGVVGSVISTDAFLVVFPGHLLLGLSSRTVGSRYYLDATTAGAVTTTAPAIKVPIYDAVSATAAVLIASGAGGSNPTEDGTVLASDSSGLLGEWTRLLDLGRNAVGKAGRLQILSPDASGVAIEIDGALVTASTKKLTIREIDICEAGTAKKMLVVASATY